MMDRDTGDFGQLIEVIGDIVDIPGMPPDSCAVHALVNLPAAPFYAVSHIDSGWRVAGGDSIEFAIQQAREVVARVGPETVATALKNAIAVRRKIELLEVMS